MLYAISCKCVSDLICTLSDSLVFHSVIFGLFKIDYVMHVLLLLYYYFNIIKISTAMGYLSGSLEECSIY